MVACCVGLVLCADGCGAVGGCVLGFGSGGGAKLQGEAQRFPSRIDLVLLHVYPNDWIAFTVCPLAIPSSLVSRCMLRSIKQKVVRPFPVSQ